MLFAIGVAAVIAALLVIGFVYEKMKEAGDRKRYPPPGQLVDVGGGRRLHLFTQGDAPGPTVVIEQGNSSPSIVWAPVQAAIAKFARVCTYDRAGFLWSDPAPSGDRDLDARVTDLHALLTRGQVPGPYVLVGHSLGGLLVRRFARRYPDLVAGMVLVDSPDESVIFRDSIKHFYRQGVQFQGVLKVLARFGLLRLLGRRIPMLMLPDDPVGYALCVTPAHATACAGDMHALLTAPESIRRRDPNESLGDRPLILLKHGVPFPPMAAAMEEGWDESVRDLARLSTNSEVIAAEKSGHLIYVDQPDLIVDSVRRVLQKIRE
jgi:pimeloyl-ACP methyl ester carboxylesterase